MISRYAGHVGGEGPSCVGMWVGGWEGKVVGGGKSKA